MWAPNKIYEALVTDNNDVVGMVAYGLYKRKKIEFINAFQNEHGRVPREEDLFPFHSTALLHLEEYRDRATQLSYDFTEVYISEFVEQIEDSYSKEYQKKINSLKPSWFHGIISSLIGSLLFIVLIGLISVAAIGIQTNIWNSARTVLDHIEHPPAIKSSP